MNAEDNTIKFPHYYGNVVRMLFLVSALIMLVGLPALVNYIELPAVLSVIAILLLGLAAGLTNPAKIWAAATDVVIAMVGFLVFESYAVWSYQRYSGTDKFFLANLALGFIFMLAIYFSVKTFRGIVVKDKTEKHNEAISYIERFNSYE